MKRAMTALIAMVVAALVAGTAIAWAATTTTTINGGDTLNVKCNGSQLNWSRPTGTGHNTNMTLKCRPKPTTSSASPTPTVSQTVSQSPSPTPTNTSGYKDSCNPNCGPYNTSKISNANGSNTYVGNNPWGCGTPGSCGPQTTRANGPSSWQTLSNQAANSGSVKTYPNTQQLTNNYNGTDWDCTPACGFADTPMDKVTSMVSTYDESTPYGGGVIAQFAWDVWVGNAGTNSDEIMIWVDNSGRDPEDAGATFDSQQTIAGQVWSLYFYGGHGGETIWSLGARHAAAQQASGTVDIKALFDSLVSKGYQAATAQIGQIDAGWEICSTGGVQRAFTVNDYTLSIA